MTVKSQPRKRRWSSRLAIVLRWIHIYISMLGFAALMFFGFTGLTLNHPTWFGASEVVITDEQGELPEALLATADGSEQTTDKLAIAEWLRAEHHLSGRVTEFSADEFELFIVFKGPAYSVDIFVERTSRKYTLTESRAGIVAALNDLHKGRDSGEGWAWLIDVSAVVTLLMSVSGFALIFYIRRRRTTGLLSALAGTVAMVVVWWTLVP